MNSIELHSSVRVATISDALDLIGIRHNAMSGDIKPIDPLMKIRGYAATIAFEIASDYDFDDPYSPAIDFLDSLQAGEVAVVATGKSVQSAFWGELFSTAAKQRGSTGIISDGPLRDVNQIFEVGLSAFGTGTSPYDYKGRMRVTGIGSEVECGGVKVSPGDFIIGDIDGVVVVPRYAIDTVFAAANARALGENHVLKDLKTGSSVRAAWDKYHIL
jgi:4-hydroxy-4-methyl-2-oxoglutarate aldolase